ncbi:hypothetical protein QQS21_010572 [Conoideocrella luteorostrata]|uniref:Peptidase M61 catalytic domain-containing protein n=1 Tax=Conoideocrella luteorostrata TaxID=1105319 RepID=A0AAJ0FUI6_9HYPO|nr:hypothetical protein QQS21_010572 [Conoideocrella luteorostrata]
MGEIRIQKVPSLRLRLTPEYSPKAENGQNASNPTAIYVHMVVRARLGRFSSARPFLSMPLNRGPTETARYDGDAMSASTIAGAPLSLHYQDEKDGGDMMRQWYLDETLTEGDVIVQFLAPARKTDKFTPSGPRIDLREDVSGGLIGMGEGFIPIVPPCSDDKSEEWDVAVEWAVEDAPEGTRCAWSMGDGVHCKSRGTLDSVVTHSVFAIGQLKRYPDWGAKLQKDGDREFAMYWFGEPFLDMTTLPATTSAVFNAIASFFSSSNPFRVFMRKVHVLFGGTGATESYLLEYSDPSAGEITEDIMTDLLAHETVHEYALLESSGPLPDGQQQAELAWYDEGIANYYGCIAGHRGGALSHRQLLKSLNGYTQAYYTSPVINMNYDEALRRAWDNLHIMRISYGRGFMYLLAESARLQLASNGTMSIDDITLELYRRRVAKKSHTLFDYRSLIADAIGKDEENKNYEAMFRGDTIVPHPDCLASIGLKLVRRDAERFELGFDSRPMVQEYRIRNLVKGSRAEHAGVEEGDEVVEAWMAWGAADYLDAMMRIKVRREGKVKEIEWWPRSAEKVDCYAWVEI